MKQCIEPLFHEKKIQYYWRLQIKEQVFLKIKKIKIQGEI